MKNFLFSFILFIISNSFLAQSNEIIIDELKQTYHIENSATDESILLLKTKENTQLSYFDSAHQIQKSFTIKSPDSSFKQLIASTLTKNNVQLFWSTASNKKLFIQSINLETQETQEIQTDYNFKGQVVLTECTNGASYYIITLKRHANVIVVHEFKGNGTFEQHEIDFSKEQFFTLTPTKPFDLSHILSKTTEGDMIPNKIQFIDQKQPTALSLASKLKKAYLKGNQLIITFDYNTNHTDVISIDLNDKSYEKSLVTKPKISYSNNTSSNSFIHDNFIYQVKANKDEFHVTIKTMKNELVKHWITKENETINYMVDAITQFNGSQNKFKSLETTAEFIKKFNNLHGGLSVYTYKNEKLLTIGAVSIENKQNNYAMYFGLLGAVADIALGPRTTLSNLDAYANRKTIYFNTVINAQHNTSTSYSGNLAIDQINQFIEMNHKQMSFINVSIKNNSYYLGYYDKDDKKYKWQLFKD